MRESVFLPRDLEDKVDRELESGERIEWLQMPVPCFFTPGATVGFLFAIPWTGFAIFWMCGAAGFKIPDFESGMDLFPLFGLPFVLIGLAMLSSPLWVYRGFLRTVYVITNKRAITFQGGRVTTIRSYRPEKLQDVYRTERRDGTGDIIIRRDRWRDSDGDRQSQQLGFFRIRNPREVEQMLRRLAEQVPRPTH